MQARFSTPSSLAAHHRRLMASCAESGCPQVRQRSGAKLSARTVGESLCMSKSVEAHYKGQIVSARDLPTQCQQQCFSGSPHSTRATMSDRTERQVTSEAADEATGTRTVSDIPSTVGSGLFFHPLPAAAGHPRSVGGGQDRFVVARIAGRALANCESASLFAAQ